MTSEAQRRAVKKYTEKNIKWVSIGLHVKNDADIIRVLEGIRGRQRSSFIKEAIRDALRGA